MYAVQPSYHTSGRAGRGGRHDGSRLPMRDAAGPWGSSARSSARWGGWRRSTPEQWKRFIEFMFAQMRELLTNYGPLGLVWFDRGMDTREHALEFVNMVRACLYIAPSKPVVTETLIEQVA